MNTAVSFPGEADGEAQASMPMERLTPVAAQRLCLAVAAALLVSGAALAWIAWTGAWLVVTAPDAQAATIERQDILARNHSPYESALLQWPLITAASLVAAAVLLGGAAMWARGQRPPTRGLVLSAWWLVTYGCFLSLLVGLRWFGFYAARALDPGPSMFRPGPAAFTTAAVGALGLALCLGLVGVVSPAAPRSRGQRLSRWNAAIGLVAAGVLCALALVPVGRSGDYLIDELTLGAIEQAPANALHEVATGLALARSLLWACVGLAALAWAGLRAVPVEVAPQLRRQVPWSSLALLPLAAGLTYATFQTYRAIAHAEAVIRPTPTYVLPIASAALLGLNVLLVVASMRSLRLERALPSASAVE